MVNSSPVYNCFTRRFKLYSNYAISRLQMQVYFLFFTGANAPIMYTHLILSLLFFLLLLLSFEYGSKQISSGCNSDRRDSTVQIICIGTDRSQQTVQTKIRLLLKKQSDQGLRCLPFHPHLLNALMQCYVNFFLFFRTIMAIV